MELELRHHRHAVALDEHRHFQRAARALGISQPALSRSILELERRMGAALFARTRDGAHATDVGRVFLARARAVLAQAGDLEREMRLIRGLDTGELRVGAGVYPSEMFVAAAVARMARPHPTLRLTVVSNSIDTLLQMLKRREIDLAVGDLKTAESERGLRVTPLAWHKGYLVVRAGHPLLGAGAPKLREILRFPLALTTRVPPDLLSSLIGGRAGAKPASPAPDASAALPAITCDSPSMMKAIVARTDAVTLMPTSLIVRELEAGTLAALPFEAPWLGRRFAIIELADRSLSPAAQQFVRHLVETDAEAAAMVPPEPARPREKPASRASRTKSAPDSMFKVRSKATFKATSEATSTPKPTRTRTPEPVSNPSRTRSPARPRTHG